VDPVGLHPPLSELKKINPLLPFIFKKIRCSYEGGNLKVLNPVEEYFRSV
jgi:hypothetical protein